MALWRIEADGSLTLANSYTYSTWGTPSTATHNSIPDLGFRFLYVGAHDVQWDDAFGLGLLYMHARHYSPSLGRFLQPDPSRLDEQFFVYADSSPTTKADPDGACSMHMLVLCGGIGGWGAVGGRWTRGAIGSSKSIIARASTNAYRAAKSPFSVKRYHLQGGSMNFSKFRGDQEFAQDAVRAALNSRNAAFKPNYRDGVFDPSRFRVETNLGRIVGTKGETGVRVVVDWKGRVVTAFPIKMARNSPK
jgi:RHS repeat-associated protein